MGRELCRLRNNKPGSRQRQGKGWESKDVRSKDSEVERERVRRAIRVTYWSMPPDGLN